MMLTTTRRIEFIFNELDETICKNYDEEQNISERINFEARLVTSSDFKNYYNKRFFEYTIISKSIEKTKFDLKQKSSKITDNYLNSVEFQRNFLIGNFNTVFFKSIYEFCCNILLNINRYNSK